MLRIVNLLLLAAMIGGALLTYNLKHHAEVAADRVARLNANIADEREAIALLKTEWSLLTQPGRLQALVTKYEDHFKLQPFSASQVATLDEIPRRPEAQAETTLAAAPEARPAR